MSESVGANGLPPDVVLPITDPMSHLDLLIRPQSGAALSAVRKRPTHWTADEDEQLLAAVKLNGTNNWPVVAAAVGGRTRAQCAQRWHRCLDSNLEKRNWTFEEEQKLLEAVLSLGNKAWTRVAAAIGRRSDVQCRWRYKFLAKKAVEAGTEIRPISPITAVRKGGDAALNQ
jgi:hypothetical protein